MDHPTSKTEADQLINSIEDKLQALFSVPSNNSQSSNHDGPLHLSHVASSKRGYHKPPLDTRSDVKRPGGQQNQQSTSQRMNVKDLEGSYIREFNAIATPERQGASSNVLQRINKMEDFYVETIKKLEEKVAILEETNEQLRKKVMQQTLTIGNLEAETVRRQAIHDQEVEKRVQELQQKMMRKIGDEAVTYYSTIQQSKDLLKQEIAKQKKLRLAVQDQLEDTKRQMHSLEGFYKSLVLNHRRLLQADIARNQQSLCQSRITDRSKEELSMLNQYKVMGTASVGQSNLQTTKQLDQEEVEDSEVFNSGVDSRLSKDKQVVHKKAPKQSKETKSNIDTKEKKLKKPNKPK